MVTAVPQLESLGHVHCSRQTLTQPLQLCYHTLGSHWEVWVCVWEGGKGKGQRNDTHNVGVGLCFHLYVYNSCTHWKT